MALVDYSDSEDDEEKGDTKADVLSTNLKRKREDESSLSLPPLPSKFHDLYASATRISTRDDPRLHGGRKRVIPHIEGNWPTHLYIEWYPSNTESNLLTALISKLQAIALPDELDIQSSLTSDLAVPLPLHVSLSRSLGFSAESKGEFVEALEEAINSSGIRPFDIQCSGLDWVANFEKTRWFLILRLQRPVGDGLNRLLNVCNVVTEDYHQPPLYKAPRESNTRDIRSKDSHADRKRMAVDSPDIHDASDAFHFSIAWTLERPRPEVVQFTHALITGQLDDIRNIMVKVNAIKAKVGNVVSNMPLPTDIIVSKGLFGI